MSKLKKLQIGVLGASGQMGKEFLFISQSYEFMHFEFFTKQQIDISDAGALETLCAQKKYDYLINCAAYTAVDKAEDEADMCFAINAEACKHISNAIKSSNTKLIHFSTDYVYDTYDGFPLEEKGAKNPRSVYAKSKLLGEQYIRESGVDALIIRTSWVVSSFGHNFVKTMMRLGKEKHELKVVNDQFGAITYARHLASTVLDIITIVESDPTKAKYFNDTYNYANEGITTWFDIASYIMKEEKYDCNVYPISTKEYPTKAKRPFWSVLSKNRIKNHFGIDIPHWYTALQECISNIKGDAAP